MFLKLRPLMLLAVLALLMPGLPAAASISDDWALIKSCGDLRAFQARYGGSNRYARFYSATDAKLGCTPKTKPKPKPPVIRDEPRPRPRPTPYVAPYTAPYVPQPASKYYVTLDQNGGGDATTLSGALNLVQAGGTIVVRPGNYPGAVTIYKSVTIRGVKLANNSRPAITSTGSAPTVTVSGGNVRIEGLYLSAGGSGGSALHWYGGNLTLVDSVFDWGGTPGTTNRAGDATLYLQGPGSVTMTDVVIFPGRSVTLAVTGGTVTMTGSLLRGQDKTIAFFSGGNTQISGTRFDGLQGIHVKTGATVTVRDAAFSGVDLAKEYPVYVSDRGSLTLSYSYMCTTSKSGWYSTQGNASLITFNMYDAYGQSLTNNTPSTLANAQDRCAR